MRKRAPKVPIGRHIVGNALVLHTRDRISSEARSLALAVTGDADNDIVLLDLHDNLPMGLWETVADELPRRRRGIRLLVCGASPDMTALAGRWLADRLGRAVVVPHGHLLRGAAGTLYVHAKQESGWVRNRPGRAPTWAGKRYPSPVWDDAAAAYLPTSAHGVVEPLPGGAWIRDTRDAATVAEHWQWLASAVPCQPDAFTVVLGCPDTPELALDDVARFWRGLSEVGRRHARFVHYGPIRLPAGETLGQALADLLGAPVTCFTGVPVGRPEQPQLYTVPADGRAGWQTHVRELGYQPRPRGGIAAPPPEIVSCRAPAVLGEEIEPRVHRYASDAVVEIVQSGLWIRPPKAPHHAVRVRARTADPAVHAVLVDDDAPALVPRLRELAEDMAARLDDATRARSVLQLASAVAATPLRPPTPANGSLQGGLTYRFTAADLGLDRPVRDLAAPEQAEPGVDLAAVAPVILGSSRSGTAKGALGPQGGGALGPQGGGALGPQGGGALGPQARTPTRTATPAPISAPTRAPVPALAPTATTVPALASTTTAGPAALRADPTTTPAPTSALAPIPARGPITSGVPVPPTLPEPFRPSPIRPEESGRVRFQQDPVPEARGVPGPDGLAVERAWLRRTLTREFDVAEATVSRILAENPGPYAGPDAMADAVAVRLYLSPLADGLNAALRAGLPCPETSFARCIVAGLSRLPSHRGPVLLRAELTAEDLRTIVSRGVLTDWGFTNALTQPVGGLRGTVDILIWSMTGRRTRLLEPSDGTGVPARVLFRPGTSFKVLTTTAPGSDRPGRLILRELAGDETHGRHVPFDDLALSSLQRTAEQWATAKPTTSFGVAGSGRFSEVPGLC